MYLFAQIISIISNPIVFAFPASYALVYKTTGNTEYAMTWAIISLLVTALIALFVFYGVHKKFFNDFDVSERLQRKPLFVFGAIIVLLYGLFIMILRGPRVLLVALTGVAFGIFLDSLINVKIKVSVHVATYAAFATGMSLLYGRYALFLIVFIPLVAWSRVTIKRHTLQETIIGAVLGMSIVTVMYVAVRLLV